MQSYSFSYAFDTIESGQMLFGAASFLGFIPYIIVFMIKSFQVRNIVTMQ